MCIYIFIFKSKIVHKKIELEESRIRSFSSAFVVLLTQIFNDLSPTYPKTQNVGDADILK